MPDNIGTSFLEKNTGTWNNRLIIGQPMVGLVRAEWVQGRYGQIYPTNWSHIEFQHGMSTYIPLRYQIADAENIIAKQVVEHDFEWLLFIEHDNVLPPGTFVKINQYMIKADVPIVGALYFTKSEPPEPMVYRKFGNGYFADFKLGDKVWVKGLPFGCTLIHGSIIKALWKESPEYLTPAGVTRRIFYQPDETISDGNGNSLMYGGTTDLRFCKDVIDKKIFEKAGWKKYQKMKFPFLIDTEIFVKHIDQSGVQWPTELPQEFLDGKKTFRACLK